LTNIFFVDEETNSNQISNKDTSLSDEKINNICASDTESLKNVSEYFSPKRTNTISAGGLNAFNDDFIIPNEELDRLSSSNTGDSNPKSRFLLDCIHKKLKCVKKILALFISISIFCFLPNYGIGNIIFIACILFLTTFKKSIPIFVTILCFILYSSSLFLSSFFCCCCTGLCTIFVSVTLFDFLRNKFFYHDRSNKNDFYEEDFYEEKTEKKPEEDGNVVYTKVLRISTDLQKKKKKQKIEMKNDTYIIT
jgi:hypothetical protein